MSEHLSNSKSKIISKSESGLELIEATSEKTFEIPKSPDVNPVEQAAQQIVALKAAEKSVGEAIESKSLKKVLATLDFSQDKHSFVISDTYHAEATTGHQNTRVEGRGSRQQGGNILSPQYYDAKPGAQNKWGNPRDEAYSSGQPVERVGIRASASQQWGQTEKDLPIPGWRGKLGFKSKQMVSELKQVEPVYTFDYEFAAPSVKREGVSQEALDAGNRAGQNIRLSVELSKEQAQALSKVLEKDPTVARTILDKFVAQTGDAGKWDAEIYDEDGKFYDPGERYGKDFVARDVRPRYDAVPNLMPKVVGLFGQDAASENNQKSHSNSGYIKKAA